MATIGDILARKWPGAEWTLSEDSYASLAWLSPGDAPSEPEIRAFSAEVDEIMRRELMVVTPRQFRLALLEAGLLDACEAVVAGAARSARISWEFAVSVERLSPLIDAFAAQMGKTPAEVDAIFEAASQIGG